MNKKGTITAVSGAMNPARGWAWAMARLRALRWNSLCMRMFCCSITECCDFLRRDVGGGMDGGMGGMEARREDTED